MHPDRKAHLTSTCRGALDTLAARCSGLIWASVSTRDGIEIASIGGAPNEKLSVIVSTMHALSEGIAVEADLGDCRSTILEAGQGRVVILSVSGATEDLVLAGMAKPDTSLGMLLSCCTMACQEVTLASPALPSL
jgi:predicted regulator of Ras-like GTPase activity (Roadblock/LC7/MglB family)